MPQAVRPANQVLAVVWRQRGTVRSDVGQTHPPCACAIAAGLGDLQRAETLAERDLLFVGQVLVGKDQQGVLLELNEDILKHILVYFLRQIRSRDVRADGFV